MKNYRKLIDDFFREKLGSYSETPPPDVWDSLSGRLDGLKTAPIHRIGSYWHVAAVAVAIVASVSLFKNLPQSLFSTHQPIAANQALQNPATPVSDQHSAPSATSTVQHESVVPASQTQAAASPMGTVNRNANTVNETGNVARANTRNTAHINPTTGHTARSRHLSNKHAANNLRSAGNEPATEKDAATDGGNGVAARGIDNGPADMSLQGAGNVKDKTELPASKTDDQAAKEKDTKPNPAAAQAIAANEMKAVALRKFEAGVKVGYEGGFNNGAAVKWVIAPYLQYNIGKRFSLLTQPAIKSATVSGVNIGSANFFRTSDPGHTRLNTRDTNVTAIGAHLDTTYTTNYTYYQNHDSIVKSYTYGGTYMEFELPVLLKYKLTKHLSAYGGVSLNYSRLVSINSSVAYTRTGIADSVSLTNTSTTGNPLSISNVFHYPGYNISDTKTPVFVSPDGNIFRVGYMVGFSYECGKKWLFDGLIQQSPVKTDVQGGYNVNAPFSSAYFRLTVGYKFFQ